MNTITNTASTNTILPSIWANTRVWPAFTIRARGGNPLYNLRDQPGRIAQMLDGLGFFRR
jgi:hypothetical protein